jgi:hypothetical protein
MKFKTLLFTTILLVFSMNSFSCPKIKGILIDACGTREELNEWMVLTTDTAIVVNNLRIDYDINNNSGGAVNADITSGGCSWITPRASSIDSLKINSLYNSNIISVSPGSTIPANSTILVLTSDSMNFAYDITNLTQYGNVYVIQSSCKRNTGAFTNLGNGANYRITKIIYNTCRDSVRHYIGNSAVNGQYGVRNRDTMRILYGNILNSSCNEYIILPIELLSFAVDCNKIEFITLSESNVQMFYIETSTDASSWFVIDSLIPKNYSNIPTTYSIINPNLGQYFRLKEVDYDKVLYSNIYYNKCGINIESYELYNLLGQKVEEDNLPSGIYIKKYKNKTIKIIR